METWSRRRGKFLSGPRDLCIEIVWMSRLHSTSVQLDSTPQIPTMNTFSTLGNCSVTVSDLDLLRILFHGDSISANYGAR